MSVTSVSAAPAAAGRKNRTRCHSAGGVRLGQDESPEARKRAALILEVLAGVRTPAQAATALGVSLPRYYQLESRALRGLLAGCESKPRGPGRSLERELAQARRDHQRLQRELGRQQALVRMAQRSIGVPPAAPLTKPAGAKKRPRRPVARALSAAAHLQRQVADKPLTESVAEDNTATA
jgi:hypothetical protein